MFAVGFLVALAHWSATIASVSLQHHPVSQWNGTLATMKKIQRNSPRGLGGGHGRRTMRDRHVGDVIVVDERETGLTPIGIVTDRDLVGARPS